MLSDAHPSKHWIRSKHFKTPTTTVDCSSGKGKPKRTKRRLAYGYAIAIELSAWEDKAANS